ncbi:MAG: hypothetical protein GX650_06570 [Clostridiales bacterium]|mgnify:CR=1 FL=1|nr:hypothetical protein [Clostridiales bacterium]
MQEVNKPHKLAAALALRGISRKEAARALHLSRSALDKRLRGAAPWQPCERRALQDLLLGHRGKGECHP